MDARMHAELRSEFVALDRGLAYLDWGSTGLLARATRVELDRYYDVLAECPANNGIDVHVRGFRMRHDARHEVARMIGAEANDVAFVESTTQGIQIASECTGLQRGDNVLVFDLDYPAVSLPWMMRRRSDGIDVRFVPSREGRFEVADLVERIDDRTRVVAVSTVCWVTGALTDVPAIAAECRARGIVLVVDAIQTCGVVPLDVRALGASWVAVGGLKWLCATPGSGFLWVDPRVAARAHPTRFGILAGSPSTHAGWQEWLTSGTASIEDEVVFAAQGRALETGGTINYPCAIGLLTMARLLARIPASDALEHVRGLAAQLMAGLDALGLPLVTPRDPARHANIVAFRLPAGHAAELAILPKLWERGIAVNARWLKSVGGVRVSIHVMNGAEDIDRLLVALRALA